METIEKDFTIKCEVCNTTTTKTYSFINVTKGQETLRFNCKCPEEHIFEVEGTLAPNSEGFNFLGFRIKSKNGK